MRARITDNQHVYLDNISTAEEDVLFEEMSASDPNIYVDTSMTMWDGVIRKYNRAKQRIPRPLLTMLKEICEKYDFPLQIEDDREVWEYEVMPRKEITRENFLPGIVMDEHQWLAALKIARSHYDNECGIISVPTGGGKGEIICAFCKVISCPTVVLADQRVVIDQLKERLELRDVVEEVGVFYAGKKPDGQMVVCGSIQSLTPPTTPPVKPTRDVTEDDEEWEVQLKKYEAKLAGFKSRRKNARVLLQYVKQAEMLLVDECDKAVSDSYKRIFRHHFKGRRRYGFCLAGDSIVKTIFGNRRLDSFHDGEEITLLSEFGSYQRGTVVSVGVKKQFVVTLVNGLQISGSCDHLIAKDDRSYIRFSDLVNGDVVKIENDGFVNKLESFADAFSVFDPSFYFSNISWSHFQFTRPDFEQEFIGVEVDDIFSFPFEIITDSGELCLKRDTAPIQKLHEQKFIGGTIVVDIPTNRDIIASCEFSRKFQPTTTISLAQCFADFFSDNRIVNGVATEFFPHDFDSLFDRFSHQETNGDSILFYHCFLNSFDHFLHLHRMVNTISLDTGGSPFCLIIERLTTVDCFFDRPSLFLVFRNGEPIFNAVFFKHFLFISFKSDFGTVFNTGEIFDAIRTQMSSELSHLVIWSINRALKNIWTIVASNRDDILVSGLAVIPFSLDDHVLSSLKGAPYYLCSKETSVESVDCAEEVEMFDVLNVSKTSNFVANDILVHNSGTPFDPDKPVAGLVMQEHLGPVIVDVPRKYLEKIGRIIRCECTMMVVGAEGNIKESSAYDIAREDWMAKNPKFHQLIAAICKRHKGDGNLVLVDIVELGKQIVEACTAVGLEAHFIYGKTSKRRRDELLRGFERREFDVLIGGKIINRGLDLDGGCENLIIATGGKLQSDYLQKIGRALRHNRDGISRVYDFFFRCNKHLYKHSKARLQIMVRAGYETRVVFPGGVLDGAKLIKSRWRVSPKLLKKE